MPIAVPTNCNWGQIKNAYVPAVTYCHLIFDQTYNYDIGSYQNGFWVQYQTPSLPFLSQSWKGTYISPPLNQPIPTKINPGPVVGIA